MISHNIKWFLTFSVAVHAAVLVAWPPPAHRPGNPGQVLMLAVRNHTGETVITPQHPTETATPAATDTTPRQPPLEPSPMVAATPVRQPPVTPPAARARTEPPASAPAQDRAARPAQAMPAASTTLSPEEQDQHLRACVMNLITRQLSYPAIARRKGWQGVVRLELHIEPDGRISDLHIEQTSGYTVLDEAARQSLQLANIPDAAQWLQGETASIVVPVEYRLIDG